MKVLVICVAALLAGRLFGQSFEVASVRASRPGPAGYAPMRIAIEPGGRITASDAPLRNLVMLAYGVTELQISGGPAWVASDGFDIQAKPERPSSSEQAGLMLRVLLAERFGLRMHREMRQARVETLVVGARSVNLRPTAFADDKPSIVVRAADARRVSILGRNVTSPFLAGWLSGKLRRVVVDESGLSGSFDFEADLAIDAAEALDPNTPEREVMLHLFEGLPEKLGLRLKARDAQVETIVVDHAEKPSEN